MARSMWKGFLAFGLVNIPVELYSATRDHRPKFRLLHAKDEEPVRYERVCQKDGKPVAWEDQRQDEGQAAPAGGRRPHPEAGRSG